MTSRLAQTVHVVGAPDRMAMRRTADGQVFDVTAWLRGLRFVDSFFPSGGYAFSGGLETAVHEGAVRNARELATYVADLLRQSVGVREAGAVGLAHDGLLQQDLQAIVEVDWELEAMIWGAESRQASRQMGRQVIRAATEIPAVPAAILTLDAMLRDDATPGHLSVMLGATLAACGWPRDMAIAGFLYQTVVGFVSAALKLLPMGQREGQRLLEEWSPLVAELTRAQEAPVPLQSWAPLHDIFAMRHSWMESRLFRS